MYSVFNDLGRMYIYRIIINFIIEEYKEMENFF